MKFRTVRTGDMHPNRCLAIHTQRDGDIILRIEQNGAVVGEPDMGNPDVQSAEVEYCLSGGRSPNTREALYALIAAIEKDKNENPIDGEDPSLEGR